MGFSCMDYNSPTAPFFSINSEFKTVIAAWQQSTPAIPAQMYFLHGNGLIEQLHTVLLTGPAGCPYSQLPGLNTIKPVPCQQSDYDQNNKLFHPITVTEQGQSNKSKS